MAWERLASVAGSGGTTLSSGTFSAKKNLRIIAYLKDSGSGGNIAQLRFNGDSGSNYATRASRDGGSDTDWGSINRFISYHNSTVLSDYLVIDITNISGEEKLVIGHNTGVTATGAGTAPVRQEWVGKWVNTSQITSLEFTSNGSGFTSDSYITVLGAKEPSPASSITVDGGEDNTVTFSDGFTSDNWTDTDDKIAVNTSNERLEFDTRRDSTDDKTVYDLQTDLGSGTNASDTAWLLRYELTWSTIGSGDTNYLFVGLSDSAVAHNSNADRITTQYRAKNSTHNTVYASDTDGGSLGGSSGDNNAQLNYSTGTTYYVTMRRTSATAYDISIKTGSHSGTEVVSLSGTVASTVDNLRYIVVQNLVSSGSATATGYIDNMEFYNGVTSARKGFTAKKHLKIQMNLKAENQIGTRLRVNGDAGSNYAFRYSSNGASDGTGNDVSELANMDTSAAGQTEFHTIDVVNEEDKVKTFICEGISNNGNGTSNIPRRRELAGKWDNTTEQITSVNVVDYYSGSNFADGSEVIVWGSDGDADTTYPTLVGGYIFEETDTGKHYIFDGSSTWTEVA